MTLLHKLKLDLEKAKLKIAELEELLEHKDQRIIELEADVDHLELRVAELLPDGGITNYLDKTRKRDHDVKTV